MIFFCQNHFSQFERLFDQRRAEHQRHDRLLRQTVDERPSEVGRRRLGRLNVDNNAANDWLGLAAAAGVGRPEAAELEVEGELVVGKKAEDSS